MTEDLSGTIQQTLIKARYLLGQDDFKQAADCCRQVLAQENKNVDAMLLLGSVAEKTGAHEAAASVFSRVLTIESTNVPAHLGLGTALSAAGRWSDAAEIYRKAIELDPAGVDALNGLGTAQIAMGDRSLALSSFEQALRASPQNEVAAYMVAALKGRGMPPRSETIRASFDRYADKFEKHLTAVLGYRMPQLIADLLAVEHPAHFAAALDLGCGTGLLADAMPHDRVVAMDGVDLAPRMVEAARKKQRYRSLVVGNIADYLRTCPASGYDLIVSADVFIYVGPLEEIFAGMQHALTQDGLICISVEHTETDNYEVQASSRYAHGIGYIDRLAAKKRYGTRDVELLCVASGERR